MFYILTERSVYECLVSNFLLARLLLEEQNDVVVKTNCRCLLGGTIETSANPSGKVVFFPQVEIIMCRFRTVFVH